MGDFISFLIPTYLPYFIPALALLVILALAVRTAFIKHVFGAGVWGLFVGGMLLVLLALLLEITQPIIQLYLEEELEMIFLEANKYTGVMRNVRYVLYPLGMFLIGLSVLEERFEDAPEPAAPVKEEGQQ